MSRAQTMREWTESIDGPISWVSSASNSSTRRAKSTNSVVHTGGKSAGWLNSTIHLPVSSASDFSPWG